MSTTPQTQITIPPASQSQQSQSPVGGVCLERASAEWSNRPADQRFSSIEGMHTKVLEYRRQSREAADVEFASLRTLAEDGEVLLVGKGDKPSRMTHWSFGQLSQRIGAPPSYLRDLPATLAVQNLNHGLKAKGEEAGKSNLLLRQNGGYTIQAFTSADYTRIWNSDITSRLLRLCALHPEWQPAPAAFDGSRGLYASDHDMFAFLVDNERRIFEQDPGGGLSRGFFVWNSEVGAKSFGIMSFLYEYVCGNHRVWGAQGISELRIRHVGNADDRAFGELEVELKKYSEGSAGEIEEQIRTARTREIGADKDEVLDRIFGLRIPTLSRRLLSEGYEKASEHEDWYGSPRTVWGMAGGITEVARDMEFADRRVEVERAAGRLMEVAF